MPINPADPGRILGLYNLARAAGLAKRPLLTGFSVGRSGFTAAMISTAAVLALLGAASLLRLPAITRS